MEDKSTAKGILGRWDATSEEIRQAMGIAIYAALREHKRQGVPAATMRDGKVILVPPEEIEIPDEFKHAEEPAVEDAGSGVEPSR